MNIDKLNSIQMITKNYSNKYLIKLTLFKDQQKNNNLFNVQCLQHLFVWHIMVVQLKSYFEIVTRFD